MQAISKIILGSAQFGLDYGINNTSGRPDELKVLNILSAAFSSGIRCLDTAEAYGNAHDVIGRFHEENPDKKFNVITKLPHHIDQSFDQKIKKYLRQLNIEYIEGLLFHSYQTYKENKQILHLLNNYKLNGMVRNIGVSVYTNDQLYDVLDDSNVDIVQLPFNLFDNVNLRGEAIRLASEKGKKIHTRSAFLQGLFFSPIDSKKRIALFLANELNEIRMIGKESGLSIHKIAINYCLQQGLIDNVLIGVDNLSQLNKNLQDADCSLSDEILNAIDDIHIKDINLLNPSLWDQ